MPPEEEATVVLQATRAIQTNDADLFDKAKRSMPQLGEVIECDENLNVILSDQDALVAVVEDDKARPNQVVLEGIEQLDGEHTVTGENLVMDDTERDVDKRGPETLDD